MTESQETDDKLHFDKESILRKIASLQAMVDHPETEESIKMAALTKIKRLTDKYSISLTDFEKIKAYEITEGGMNFSNPLTKSRFYLIALLMKVADFLNVRLLAMAFHGREQEVHGLRLIGTEIDVKSAMVGIAYIINESKTQLQNFYSDVRSTYDKISDQYEERVASENFFGIGDHDPYHRRSFVQFFASQIAPPQMRMVIRGPGSSNDALVPYWGGPDYELMIARVAGEFFVGGTMPEIEDELWLKTEINWGIGFQHRLIERLETELAATDDDVNAELNATPKYGFTPNLPARSSRELAVISDTVREEKMSRIDEHLRDEDIMTTSVDIHNTDHEVSAIGGSRAADRVDLSALRKK